MFFTLFSYLKVIKFYSLNALVFVKIKTFEPQHDV